MANLSDFNAQYDPRDPRQVAAQSGNQDTMHQLAVGAQQTAAGNDIGATITQNATSNGKLVDQYGKPTNQGLLNQGQLGGQNQAYNPRTGQDVPAGNGVIANDRAVRQATDGATPQQIQTNQQNLQGIMNARGTASGPLSLDQKLQAVDQKYRDAVSQGQSIDPNLINNEKQTVIQQHNAEVAQQQQEHQQATQQQNDQTASSAVAASQDPHAAGMNAALSNLPPEAQALAPYFQSMLDTIEQGRKDQALTTQALLNGGEINVDGQPVSFKGITSAYDAMDKKIADMETGYVTMQQGIQGMLDKAKEQNDKNISDQEQAAKNRLEWNEQQQLRQAAKDKQNAIDSKVARLALTGGMGSDGGLRDIEQTRMQYEQHMNDIQTEFGIQRTELAAKFTGLYTQSTNAYVTQTVGNIKDTASALERIAGQSLSSIQARSNAESTVLGKFMDQQTASRKEYAGALKDAAVQMQTTINAARDDKRAQEQLGWQRMEWVATTYGDQAPQALLDSIGKQLPGVDVRSVMGQMTLAEMKKKGGGSGGGSGGSYSFTLPSKPDGNAQSYDDFVAAKRAALKADTSLSFNEIQKQLDPTTLKAEYNAKHQETTQYDPTQLQKDYQVRRMGITQASSRADTDKAFDGAMKSGDYAQAYRIVYSTGKALDNTSITQLDQIKMARSILPQLDATLRTLASNGQTGPGVGRAVKALDPWNKDMSDLQGELLVMSRAYGRGVLAEKGRLAYQEMESLKKGIADETYTPAQAISSIHKMAGYIDTALTDFVQTRKAAGENIADIQTDVETLRRENPLGPDAQMQDGFTRNKQTFLNSFPK